MILSDITDKDFSERVLKSSSPVLVVYLADWCLCCISYKPVLEKIAGQFPNVEIALLNVDTNLSGVASRSVRGVPANYFYFRGEVVSQRLGAFEFPQLFVLMNQFLSKVNLSVPVVLPATPVPTSSASRPLRTRVI